MPALQLQLALFLGGRSELLKLYSQADLFVMPSLWEAFGIAATEAMACGIPTILSSDCMITNFLTDQEDTIIVNAKDEYNIAHAIEHLLKNPEHSRALGMAGKNRLDNYFTWDRVATDFDKLYREIAAKK